jgi:thiol:disulfide interchange protein
MPTNFKPVYKQHADGRWSCEFRGHTINVRKVGGTRLTRRWHAHCGDQDASGATRDEAVRYVADRLAESELALPEGLQSYLDTLQAEFDELARTMRVMQAPEAEQLRAQFWAKREVANLAERLRFEIRQCAQNLASLKATVQKLRLTKAGLPSPE